MKFDILESKLSEYWQKFSNPKHILGDWVIVDDVLYNKLKNKLNIYSIISYNVLHNEIVIVIETKKEYYAIKYSGRFICIRRSETEYGLICDIYEMLAINKVGIAQAPKEIISFKDLCSIMGWKLGKRAKEYLDYFC